MDVFDGWMDLHSDLPAFVFFLFSFCLFWKPNLVVNVSSGMIFLKGIYKLCHVFYINLIIIFIKIY